MTIGSIFHYRTKNKLPHIKGFGYDGNSFWVTKRCRVFVIVNKGEPAGATISQNNIKTVCNYEIINFGEFYETNLQFAYM